MDSKNQSYGIIYKNSAGRNLIVYTFIDQEELVKYQLEMLANNRINGLLKSEVLRINGEVHLQYDITSLVSIKKLFERRKFSRKDFLYFFKQIIELLGMMEPYLLESGGIVFDGTYIFADPQNLELGFVYLPTKERTQSLDSLKEFLLDAIINEIRFIDEPSDNFIQRLIEMLKNPEFEESSLKKYLNEMDKVKSVAAYDLPKKEVATQLSSQPREARKINEKVKIKKLCYPAKSYIVLFSVIGTLILFCVVLVLSGILSPSNPDSLLSLFGFILIGGAVTYLVYSKLFTSDKKIERVIEKKSDNNDITRYRNQRFRTGPESLKLDARDMPPPEIINPNRHLRGGGNLYSRYKGLFTGKEYVNKAFNVPMHQSTETNRGPTVHIKSVQIQDRTAILNASNLNLPYLKRILGNGTETIIIKQFPFMMGRLESQVDYCISNPAVGKLHAEITKTNESYFISDMNSRNGTIINGERIEPTKASIIKNGDHITLGNEQFLFYCGNAN